MGFVSDLFGGGAVKAAKQASNAQIKMERERNALIEKQYQQTRTDLEPYRNAGAPALSSYMDFLGLNGAEGGARFMDMFKNASPGYQWGLDQGVQAIDRSAAARGRLNSGATGMALGQWGQDYGLQQLGNHANRFLGVAEMGQNASAQTGSFGAAAAQQMGEGLSNIGNAQAAGIIGAQNARSNAWGQLANLAGQAFGGSFGGGGSSFFGLRG